MNNVHTARRGFTMLETLVFAGVFVLIMSAIVVALNYTYRAGRFVYEQADASNEVRKGVETLVRTIRESAYADNGAFPIVSMNASEIVLYSDNDNDGSAEKIRFTLVDEALVRGVVLASGSPPQYTAQESVSTVSQFVRNGSTGVPLFTYYDEDGVEISDYTRVADMASVLIRLVVNLYPERAPEDYEIRSRATFRNVRSL